LAEKKGAAMKSKITTFIIAIGLAFSTTVFAGELTDTKKGAIKELMNVTGSAQMGQLFANAFVMQMSNVLKTTNPDIPPRAFTILKEEVNEIIKEEMVEKDGFYELIYPIYHKHFTLNDIKELIAFYNTPIGKKTVTVMPQLTQESMITGQMWGQTLGPIIQERITKRFEKEGI
jgi:hypothetical protein